MAKYNSKSNKIAIGVLFVLVDILAMGLVAALFRTETQINTETLTKYSYEVGSISEDDGTEVSSTGSIRTKSLYNVDGLTIKSKDDSTVTYKIFCYDKEEKFVSVVSDVESIPEDVTSFRLVITPTETVEIGYLQIGDYSGQVTVSFNK